MTSFAMYSCNPCYSCSIKFSAWYMLNTNYPNSPNVNHIACHLFV